MNKEEKDFLADLENDNKAMAELLQRMVKRNQDLTEQRNLYWRKALELKRALESANRD
jgi:hypothetical protein